jgi:hypothetical protein
LCILINAAVLYSAALSSSIICFALWNNGLYVMEDLVIPLLKLVSANHWSPIN